MSNVRHTGYTQSVSAKALGLKRLEEAVHITAEKAFVAVALGLPVVEYGEWAESYSSGNSVTYAWHRTWNTAWRSCREGMTRPAGAGKFYIDPANLAQVEDTRLIPAPAKAVRPWRPGDK